MPEPDNRASLVTTDRAHVSSHLVVQCHSRSLILIHVCDFTANNTKVVLHLVMWQLSRSRSQSFSKIERNRYHDFLLITCISVHHWTQS